MAGLSPFQFSSKKLQEVSTGSNWGVSIGGNVGNLLKSAFAWYEMWINPERVNISTNYQQRRQHTAGSIVTYHYRTDPLGMSVSGACGWVMINSQSEPQEAIVRRPSKFFKSIKPPSAEAKRTLASDNTDNSPRVFLQRLKSIADEPMYFVDVKGVEHYNTKFIKIYTKQFPEGVICEGYYTKFEIPEGIDDVQTINYSFEFIIENMTPISYLEKTLGMWGGGQQATRIIRGIS